VQAPSVSASLQAVIAACDLIVGTEEEFCIASDTTDPETAVSTLRRMSTATLVLKRGADGCTIYPAARGAASIEVAGFPIEVFNVLGAGDAFMAGFLSGWLRDATLDECGRRANACGALVVSRHGCAPAIPTAVELEHFLQHGATTPRLREDVALNRLHRATTRRRAPPWVAALAFDHRAPLEQLVDELNTPLARISQFKHLVARAAQRASHRADELGATCGLILDDRYGADLLPELDESGWWIARPVEDPGSRPLRFEHGRNVQSMLREWPARHIAKCLVAFDADDSAELKGAQVETLIDLRKACDDSGRELLLEVIPPPIAGDGRDADEVLLRAVTAIAAAGVLPDWWKLPPPTSAHGWKRLESAVRSADPHCRGVLVLGLDAPIDELADQLAEAAAQPLCRGFAVGRTIFGETARAWFTGEIDDAAAIDVISQRYLRLVRRFADARHAMGARTAPTLAAVNS
jgi:5-dehydro-2-deoxygluconokinase